MDTVDIESVFSPIRVLVVMRNNQTNPFTDILEDEIASEQYIFDTDIDSFWEKGKDYDVIHIHWPEYLFPYNGITPPTEEFGKQLTNTLQRWKTAGTRIVFTRHNTTSHYAESGHTKTYLYDIVERFADAIVHLGNYSMCRIAGNKVNKEQIHTLIPHHIYDTLYTNNITQEEAKKILTIPQEKKVILTFGSYRDEEEHLLVKNAFESLDIPEKYLLAPGWYHGEGWNKYVNRGIAIEGDCFLGKETVDKDMLPVCFAAADIVFLQRIRNLNSGNLPLAFLFNKTVIGPNIGNIGELLDNIDNFSFDPSDLSSVINAIEKGIKRSRMPQMNERYARAHWNTAKIADQYRELYKKLVWRTRREWENSGL